MVTDKKNYSSPAGKEFVLAAGRFAGINPSSNILSLGCDFGEGICALASEFRCKIAACYFDKSKASAAQSLAVRKKLSHLISFCGKFQDDSLEEQSFELAVLEGDSLCQKDKSDLLQKVSDLLFPRGWLSFGVPVQLTGSDSGKIPCFEEIFGCELMKEEDYRKLSQRAGFDVHFMGLVPPSGWDNYFTHLANHLEDKRGFYADRNAKISLHQKIDAYYRLEAFRYIGYLFCVARKKV